jgi:hypothetical protein
MGDNEATSGCIEAAEADLIAGLAAVYQHEVSIEIRLEMEISLRD